MRGSRIDDGAGVSLPCASEYAEKALSSDRSIRRGGRISPLSDPLRHGETLSGLLKSAKEHADLLQWAQCGDCLVRASVLTDDPAFKEDIQIEARQFLRYALNFR